MYFFSYDDVLYNSKVSQYKQQPDPTEHSYKIISQDEKQSPQINTSYDDLNDPYFPSKRKTLP